MRRAKWNLTLPLSEARKNEELISLADSQVLRWIDELNGVTDADERAKEIRSEIRRIRNEPNSAQNKRAVRKLYSDLDDIQFKPDYMCLIIDKEKDYYRACKGFSINGMEYTRLLGTNGGIKNETIVFVSTRLADELKRRIENGRDQSKELVPAKLEAYRALTCSASTPVSMPHGVLIVPDCETKFFDDVVYLDDEQEGEPVMEFRPHTEISLNASDGCGVMLPSLAQRWSEELELGFVMSGANTRMSWEKGMVFTFDFVDFAEKIAGRYIVKDAWGVERDIRDAEIILTTSMVKLWDSYPSLESYLENSVANGYTFAIPKTCPWKLENERTLNYQFIQSFDLSDADIDELIAPTMDEIRDILSGDPVKAVLYLKGVGLTEKSVANMEDDWTKAFLVAPDIFGSDPYVRRKIYHLIRNRIERAKVGVIKVHGNYSIASGDPYALCQSIFGMPVTGLLKAGEIYNQYWCENDSDDLVCFRAPMTTHENIRSVHPNRSPEAAYWYQYITTATIFNDWDTSCMALNGMDFDGDLVMLTDNPVLVRRHRPMPALMCAQRKAVKVVPTEDDIIRSNISSFGDDIGKTTNWITSMYEVASHFEPGSKERDTLNYRIKSGQLLQQNCIDRAKGVICKPMPASWHDHFAANREPEDLREFYHSIVADKKPYFMRYIYPSLMTQYNRYVRNSNKNAIREFGISMDDIIRTPAGERSDRMNEFVEYYYRCIPVGIGDCVMNRICRRFEEEFDGFLKKVKPDAKFDYTVMKSGAQYTSTQAAQIAQISQYYNQRLQDFTVYSMYEHVDEFEAFRHHTEMKENFFRECASVCTDRMALCDIMLDLYYKKSGTKKFVWDICGNEIISNLLDRSHGVIVFPTRDEQGDIIYRGERFSMHTINLEEYNEHNSE